MSNLEQDKLNLTSETASENPGQGRFWKKFTQRLDSFFNALYRNRWTAEPPQVIEGQVWGMPPIAFHFPWISDSSTENFTQKSSYFLYYFQSQGYGPTPNECVTTSTLISMNMIKDWLASQHGHPIEPIQSIEEYTHYLDSIGLRGWRYRFSTHSPLPGMMTPWQAVIALKDFARGLQKKYGKSFRVKLSAGHKLDDIIDQLREGSLILIHGAWQTTLDRSNKNFRYNVLHALMGGTPHTMILIGYDSAVLQWLLLNPADPWPVNKHSQVTPKIYKMTTQQLMEFWGRRFLFYPPRFSFTTIAIDI